MRHCHGTSQIILKSSDWLSSQRHYRKPSLFLRISLKTSNEPEQTYSTVEGATHNFLNQNGSTSLEEIPLTSTMSSPTSTPSHKKIENLFLLDRTSSYSTVPQPLPKLSKHMVTGLLLGKHLLMPPCSYSSIRDLNFNCMGDISNGSSPPYLPNSIHASSTMTEWSEFGSPSEETWNSQTSLSSLTSESSGSMFQVPLELQSHAPLNIDNSRSLIRSPMMHADNEMTESTWTQQHCATTCTFASTVEAAPMSGKNVQLRPVNKLSQLWELRPKYSWDFVWRKDEPDWVTTATITETIAPLPGPPLNELRNQTAWSTICFYPHLFCITTPINVECFHTLLSSHPNPPLVSSVCQGLYEGFWPWAKTENVWAPIITDNVTLQKIKDPAHLCFIREQHDEEITLRRFSEAFMPLLPGMTTVPLWVVPKPHSDKLQIVVDQLEDPQQPLKIPDPGFWRVNKKILGSFCGIPIRILPQAYHRSHFYPHMGSGIKKKLLK